jgi:chromosome segregation ATPase
VTLQQEKYMLTLRDERTRLVAELGQAKAERDAARADVVSLKCALSAKENELFAIADDDIDALRAQHQQELSAARAEVARLRVALVSELRAIASFIRAPDNIDQDDYDAVDQCACVLENRAAALAAGEGL